MYSLNQNELILFALDIASMLSAFAAAFFWYRASGGILRRIRRFEEVDHHDFNRVVKAYNTTQQLNSRAALATAVSAFCVATRYGATLVLPV